MIETDLCFHLSNRCSLSSQDIFRPAALHRLPAKRQRMRRVVRELCCRRTVMCNEARKYEGVAPGSHNATG